MAHELIGSVVSNKMQNTIVVRVVRKFRHTTYGKIINRHKKYKVHNEDQKIKIGDMVKIKEVRPISKEKKFIVIEKVIENK